MHGVVSARSPGTSRDAQVWTKNSEPLPHLWQDNASADWEAAYASEPPCQRAHAFLSATRDAAAVERAFRWRTIGPIMLISVGRRLLAQHRVFRNGDAPARAHGLPTFHHVCMGRGHRALPYLPPR